MKNTLNKILTDPVFSSLLTVLAGVLVTIFYPLAISIVAVVLGLIATFLGISNVIKYFKAPEISKNNLLTGLIFGVLGLTVIFEPNVLTDFVAVAFGIIILYHGIVNFESSLLIKKADFKLWYISLIFALLTIVAGILLIILKNVFINYLATIIGATLIIEGLLNTWTAIKVKKCINL